MKIRQYLGAAARKLYHKVYQDRPGGDLAVAEANKDIVTRFYNALIQGDIATVRALGRPDYIQHNPGVDWISQGAKMGILPRQRFDNVQQMGNGAREAVNSYHL